MFSSVGIHVFLKSLPWFTLKALYVTFQLPEMDSLAIGIVEWHKVGMRKCATAATRTLTLIRDISSTDWW
jgi:hypothetical protein